jgi:hypothetical protein
VIAARCFGGELDGQFIASPTSRIEYVVPDPVEARWSEAPDGVFRFRTSYYTAERLGFEVPGIVEPVAGVETWYRHEVGRTALIGTVWLRPGDSETRERLTGSLRVLTWLLAVLGG